MASSAPDDAMVGTPFGQRRLADFLPSRTAELVLHGLDLATGIEVPDDALVECGAWLVGTAVRNGYGLEVVPPSAGEALCRRVSTSTEPPPVASTPDSPWRRATCPAKFAGRCGRAISSQTDVRRSTGAQR